MQCSYTFALFLRISVKSAYILIITIIIGVVRWSKEKKIVWPASQPGQTVPYHYSQLSSAAETVDLRSVLACLLRPYTDWLADVIFVHSRGYMYVAARLVKQSCWITRRARTCLQQTLTITVYTDSGMILAQATRIKSRILRPPNRQTRSIYGPPVEPLPPISVAKDELYMYTVRVFGKGKRNLVDHS